MNAAALLPLLFIVAGCTETPHALLPTSPTPTPPAATVGPVPDPEARLLERQEWQLRMTVREVDGALVCDLNPGATREVALGMDVYENQAIVLYYHRATSPEPPQAHWTGWRHGQAYEGTGVSFEAMSCGGARRAEGSPTTLTGYFSADGQTFSAAEARRLPLPGGGETVYYVDWVATRVG